MTCRCPIVILAAISRLAKPFLGCVLEVGAAGQLPDLRPPRPFELLSASPSHNLSSRLRSCYTYTLHHSGRMTRRLLLLHSAIQPAVKLTRPTPAPPSPLTCPQLFLRGGTLHRLKKDLITHSKPCHPPSCQVQNQVVRLPFSYPFCCTSLPNQQLSLV